MKEKNNKGLELTIGILVIIIVILAGYTKIIIKEYEILNELRLKELVEVGESKVVPADTSVVDNCGDESSYSFSDFVGTYKAELKSNKEYAKINGEKEGETVQTRIHFWDDSTYCEYELAPASSTRCGNYYVKGNNIYLNSVIHIGSGAGILASEKTKVLKIEKGSLIDDNFSNTFTDDKEATYYKSNDNKNDKKMKDLIISTTESSANLMINGKL